MAVRMGSEGGGGVLRGGKSLPRVRLTTLRLKILCFSFLLGCRARAKGEKKVGWEGVGEEDEEEGRGETVFPPLPPSCSCKNVGFASPMNSYFLLRRRRRRSFSSSSILRRRFRKLWRRSFADNTKKKKNWKKKKRKTTSTFSSDPVFGSIKIRSSNRKDFGREIFCF